MLTKEQKQAMSEAVERLEIFAKALEIEEEIKDSIYNFQSYNPLEDFYSRKNIFKFPKYLVNASLRCRDLLFQLGINDLEHLRYLRKMYFLALGYLNKNIRELGFKKATEHVSWMQPFGPSDCSKLRYLMEHEEKVAIFGDNDVSWVELFVIDSCLTIEEAYCVTEFLRRASKYPELSDLRLEIAKKYKDDYIFSAFEALESISFAEGLYAAETAIVNNTKKAGIASQSKERQFLMKCLKLYEKSYKNLSNSKAAKLIDLELKDDPERLYEINNPEGKNYSDSLARWISLWKRFKEFGGDLSQFSKLSRREVLKRIKEKA